MIKEFINKSLSPNHIGPDYQTFPEGNLNFLNSELLLKDFKELYKVNRSVELFSKDCNLLIIKSTKDCILRNTSSNAFINQLNQTQIKKPTVIEIDNQGHLIIGLSIFKLIEKWLKK